MSFVQLVSSDVEQAAEFFEAFHQRFANRFARFSVRKISKTQNVSTKAKQYVHGQLLCQKRCNLMQFEKQVPESDQQSLHHFVSNSPWDEEGVLSERSCGSTTSIATSVSSLIGDWTDGSIHKDAPFERLAAMSHSRFFVECAIEDAKGQAGEDEYQLRGWSGWHHHMTLTFLAMLFLKDVVDAQHPLELQINWKPKAPRLTLVDVREILSVILPKRHFDSQEVIKLIEQKWQQTVAADGWPIREPAVRLENRIGHQDSTPDQSERIPFWASSLHPIRLTFVVSGEELGYLKPCGCSGEQFDGCT